MESTDYSLQENIQAHISRAADRAASERLLEKAQAEPAVADELAFSESLAQALRHSDLLAANAVLKSVIAEEGFPPPPDTAKGFKWKPWIFSALSISILCLIMVYYPTIKNNDFFLSQHQKTARAALKPLENVVFISADNQELTALQKGMAAYDNGRYEEAASLLESYLNRRPDQTARLYLGVSWLLSGKAQQAVLPLSEATRSSELPIREASLWYLALAYLENQNPKAARKTLQLIPKDGLYGAQAEDLLKKIE